MRINYRKTKLCAQFRSASQYYHHFLHISSSVPFNSNLEKPTYPIIPQSNAGSATARTKLDQPPVFLSPQFLRSLVASYYASAAGRNSLSLRRPLFLATLIVTAANIEKWYHDDNTIISYEFLVWIKLVRNKTDYVFVYICSIGTIISI